MTMETNTDAGASTKSRATREIAGDIIDMGYQVGNIAGLLDLLDKAAPANISMEQQVRWLQVGYLAKNLAGLSERITSEAGTIEDRLCPIRRRAAQ